MPAQSPSVLQERVHHEPLHCTLAEAMTQNRHLKVFVANGYFDLATPFFQGVYEMQHLPMPEKLQANIEYKFYQSGHMVYAQESSARALHDNVADFIRRTGAPLPPRK